MSDEEYQPEPGQWDAIQQGCICTVRDGERPDNERWGHMWLVRGCPLHDPDLNGENDAKAQ